MIVSVLCRRGIETAQSSIRSAYSLDGIAGENLRGGADSPVLVFIDVELDAPHASGFIRELASALSESQLILIADSSRYAVEAFQVDAAAYLVRPFDRGMLEKAVDRAIVRLRAAGRPAIAVQVEKGRVERVYVDDLTFIESVGYRRLVHTRSGVYEEMKMILSVFMERLERLRPGQFISPYRGYIVNLRAVREVENGRIVLDDGGFILIKRSDHARISSLFSSWKSLS